MPIPDFQTLMLPLLKIFGDEKEHSTHDATEKLALSFGLSDEEINELLPSGKQPTFYNRVGWSRTYLTKAGLLEVTKKPNYQITQRGKEVLARNPTRIDMHYLEEFPEYLSFKERRKESGRKVEVGKVEESRTPEEILDDAYQDIRENLGQDLLEIVKNSSPVFFERMVVELLVKMGYGGSRQEAARAVGQSGDGGIDGIIDEDRLGLDTIYVQAKRWEGIVGRPEIQKFIGALMGKHARKGIFITTSSFTADAIAYANNIDFKVVLVDGKRLSEYMMDYDVGVTGVTSYNLKRIDSDYFSNE